MIQIVEQTHEEEVAMYMKCTKKELIEMLINCNKIISIHKPEIIVTKDKQTSWTKWF